jgi:polar amino acid transport system substrate-binding protein
MTCRRALPGVLLATSLGMWCLAVQAETVQVVGTDHFLNRAASGATGAAREAVGPAVDLAHEVLMKAGIEHTILIYPWARAYGMTETEPNVLILSMARTPEREAKFKWVGEIAPVQYRLYKLKSRKDIRIRNLDDVKKYQVGVVNQDIAHQYLLAKKIPENAIQVTPTYSQSFRKLIAERVDLVPRSQFGFRQFCEESPADCDKIDTAYDLDEMNSSLYMAFGKQTSDEVFNKVRKAYEQVRANGTWENIIGPLLK